VNGHAARFGREIEKATARLVAVHQIGECPPVQTWLALYGALALVRNTIEALDREDATESAEDVG
jgi:hypothetical protein